MSPGVQLRDRNFWFKTALCLIQLSAMGKMPILNPEPKHFEIVQHSIFYWHGQLQ